MRTMIRAIVLPVFAALLLGGLSASVATAATVGDIDLYFSPQGGCTDAVVRAIDNATASIYVQAYSFTSKPISKALVAAKNRGLVVEVVLDKSQRSERYSGADFIAHAGIPVRIDEAHAIAHNKVIVMDVGKPNACVVTGSFNFTSSAEERNAENLLIIHRPALVDLYFQNWTEHQGHSVPYPGR